MKKKRREEKRKRKKRRKVWKLFVYGSLWFCVESMYTMGLYGFGIDWYGLLWILVCPISKV